jgi:hypothetical protein
VRARAAERPTRFVVHLATRLPDHGQLHVRDRGLAPGDSLPGPGGSSRVRPPPEASSPASSSSGSTTARPSPCAGRWNACGHLGSAIAVGATATPSPRPISSPGPESSKGGGVVKGVREARGGASGDWRLRRALPRPASLDARLPNAGRGGTRVGGRSECPNFSGLE